MSEPLKNSDQEPHKKRAKEALRLPDDKAIRKLFPSAVIDHLKATVKRGRSRKRLD